MGGNKSRRIRFLKGNLAKEKKKTTNLRIILGCLEVYHVFKTLLNDPFNTGKNVIFLFCNIDDSLYEYAFALLNILCNSYF